MFQDVVPCLDRLRAFPLGVISNGPTDGSAASSVYWGLQISGTY